MSETKQVEISDKELADLLNLPGANDTLVSDKPSFFAKDDNRIDEFLKIKATEVAKPEPKKDEAEVVLGNKDEVKVESPEAKQEATAAIDELIAPEKKESEAGRPKIAKDGAIELTKKLIEAKVLVPFDDDKDVGEYSISDIQELIEANIKDKEDQFQKDLPEKFFSALPPQLQYAAKYVMDGGQDLPALFKALSEAEEITSLSDEKSEDQETIVRQYLTATKFGSADDINEEITSWKDLGKLAEKAEKFKPKLDKLKTDEVAYKVAQQERFRHQQEEAARGYTNSVYETLKGGDLNGIRLDKKTQGLLFQGLTQAGYNSVSGRPTNLLGSLLEKYQYTEPNHSLIAEALWLLSDPEGYRTKVREKAKEDTTEQIVRKLKTEETRKITNTSMEEKDTSGTTRKIPRQTNFFKR